MSREDKMMAELKGVDGMIGRKSAVDSIPDSMAQKLHDFAIAFPTNPKSEGYLYTATLLSEKSNRLFETAKWCDDYLKLYPKGKHTFHAAFAGAHNYEQCKKYDKAIELYTIVYERFPDHPQAADARLAVKYIKLGLLTPEEQLDYAIKHRDSAEAQEK
jgi:TolA-binding protein